MLQPELHGATPAPTLLISASTQPVLAQGAPSVAPDALVPSPLVSALQVPNAQLLADAALWAEKLDLDAVQQRYLASLLGQLGELLRSWHAWWLEPARHACVAAENLDRARLLADFEAQLARQRRAAPQLIEALADFFEGLDFEQQQALRFALRRSRRASSGGRS